MEDKIRLTNYKDLRANRRLYFMLLPFLLLFTVFQVIPVLVSIFFSFTDFNVMQLPSFVGLSNYMRLFLNDPVFRIAIKNTMIIALILGPGGFAFSFLLAWLINETPRLMRSILTVIFYVPSISGSTYMIFNIFFSSDPFGWLNAYLLEWGFIDTAILWLENTSYMLKIVIGVSFWMSMGLGFLSFVAGLKTLDKAQYEAAEVDGVTNRWQELWYITLPNMKPQLLFGSVMAITGSFGVGAVTTALCGFPSTNYGAHTIVNHLEDYGLIRMEMGYGCAIAVVLFILSIGGNKLVHSFIKRVGT